MYVIKPCCNSQNHQQKEDNMPRFDETGSLSAVLTTGVGLAVTAAA
jgi:hypothetical protein